MQPLDAGRTRPLEGGPSFSLSNRLVRLLWRATWLALARFTPPQLHGWRRLLLRAFGANIGRTAQVWPSARIWLPSNLDLGENVLIGPGVELYNQGHISIGSYSVISQRAHICASSHDISDPHFQLVLRPIVIAERCWVAAEAFVGPGVVMAEGSIAAARTALFNDTEAYGVYRGNPATLVKKRRLAKMEGAGWLRSDAHRDDLIRLEDEFLMD